MQRGRPIPPLVWAFVPYAVMSIAHVVLLATDSFAAAPTKLLLMPLLAVPLVIAARQLTSSSAVLLPFAAVMFSWLGDSVGSIFPTAPELPLMLAFFGIAHLAYIALFLRHLARRRMPWWAPVYLAWWIAMLVGLGPHTGALLLGVAAYGLLLAATAALSARCHPLVAVGGALFLASDTVLAFRLFLPESLPAWSDPAVMITYTVGQGLLIGGTLMTLLRRT